MAGYTGLCLVTSAEDSAIVLLLPLTVYVYYSSEETDCETAAAFLLLIILPYLSGHTQASNSIRNLAMALEGKIGLANV